MTSNYPLAHTQGEGIPQGCEYQGGGITFGVFGMLPKTIFKGKGNIFTEKNIIFAQICTISIALPIFLMF